jgi:intraflagellar transport protein 140
MSDSIEKRIMLVEKFVQARRAAQREPDTMVAICEALLQEPLLEEAIRAGDCLAMLVEHFHSKGRMREAYTYLQEMEERKIAVHPYVDAEVLSEVYKAVGGGPGRNNNNDVDRKEFNGGRNNNNEDDEDVIDEDIDEEIEEEEEEDEDYSAAIRSNPNLSKSNGRPKSAAARK